LCTDIVSNKLETWNLSLFCNDTLPDYVTSRALFACIEWLDASATPCDCKLKLIVYNVCLFIIVRVIQLFWRCQLDVIRQSISSYCHNNIYLLHTYNWYDADTIDLATRSPTGRITFSGSISTKCDTESEKTRLSICSEYVSLSFQTRLSGIPIDVILQRHQTCQPAGIVFREIRPQI
jgi:hypothetical protein